MNFDDIGEMTLGSRLRALSDKVTKDAEQIYELYDIELKQNGFLFFIFCLIKREENRSLQ